jgi:hypothetical protein
MEGSNQPGVTGINPPQDALAGRLPSAENSATPPQVEQSVPPDNQQTTDTKPALREVMSHAREAGREKRHRAFGKIIDIMDTATGLLLDRNTQREFGQYCTERMSGMRERIANKTVEIYDKGKKKVEDTAHQAATKTRELGSRAKNEVIIPAAKKTADISIKTAKYAGKGALFLGAAATSPVWAPFVAGAYVGAQAEQYINAKEAQLKGYAKEQYNMAKQEVIQNVDLAKERARVWGENVSVEVNRVGNNAADEIDARRNKFMAKIYEIKALPSRMQGKANEYISNKLASAEKWISGQRMGALEARQEAKVQSRRNLVEASNLNIAAEQLRAQKLARNEQATARHEAINQQARRSAPVPEVSQAPAPVAEAPQPPEQAVIPPSAEPLVQGAFGFAEPPQEQAPQVPPTPPSSTT